MIIVRFYTSEFNWYHYIVSPRLTPQRVAKQTLFQNRPAKMRKRKKNKSKKNKQNNTNKAVHADDTERRTELYPASSYRNNPPAAIGNSIAPERSVNCLNHGEPKTVYQDEVNGTEDELLEKSSDPTIGDVRTFNDLIWLRESGLTCRTSLFTIIVLSLWLLILYCHHQDNGTTPRCLNPIPDFKFHDYSGYVVLLLLPLPVFRVKSTLIIMWASRTEFPIFWSISAYWKFRNTLVTTRYSPSKIHFKMEEF